LNSLVKVTGASLHTLYGTGPIVRSCDGIVYEMPLPLVAPYNTFDN